VTTLQTKPEAPRRTPKRGGAGWISGRKVALVLGAVVMLFPLYWMVVTAFSGQGSLTSGPLRWFPENPTLDGFRRAFELLPFGSFFVNSLAIALVAMALSVTLNLMAGYVLAKYRFRGRQAVFVVIVSTLMIPVQVVMVPQFQLVAGLGWIDSYWAVIVPRAAEAFGIFLCRQFMLAIPDEILEAARMDGAGHLRVFWSVVLPMCRPLIAVLVILTFMYRWNEFAWPLIVLNDQQLFTVPIGLAFLQGEYGTDYPALMGMALLSTLPVLAVFALFQKQFVEGVARSGLR